MRNTIYKNTLLLLFLFSCGVAFGQKEFDLIVDAIQLNIDGKNLVGYESKFDFSREEVRKGWWKYARKFGNPTDMRTYYQVKIPAESTDGNVDLTIYTQTIEARGETIFKIGLEDTKYKVQVEELLKVFKKDYYIKYYLDELKVKGLEAEQLSGQYESETLEADKDEALELLSTKKAEIERLKEEIRKVEEQ